MAIDFSSSANIAVNGVTKLTIDSNGYYLATAQPSFNYIGAPATAAPADVLTPTLVFNVGSYYNPANGRFTAPVAGAYLLRWNQLAQNATTGDFVTSIYKNNALINGTRFFTRKNQAMWTTLIAEGIVLMAASDYATVRYESGGAALHTDASFGSFSGHLLG